MLVRPMIREDIAAGMRLVQAAGWNQTEGDWERFLHASAEGCFVVESEGEVRGTVTTIVYEHRLAWIGMVLVNPAHRGQGVGTRLMGTALQYLETQGPLDVKLDATPQGVPLYTRLGFVAEREIERWVLAGAERSVQAELEPVARENDELALQEIIQMDLEIFGADRSALLRSLHASAPEFTAVVRAQGSLSGYTLGRRGLFANHLGPWMARDEPVARQLLERFLNRSHHRRIAVDCLKSNPFVRNLLQGSGLEYSRSLTRMVRGVNHHAGQPELLCAILGPEFG